MPCRALWLVPEFLKPHNITNHMATSHTETHGCLAPIYFLLGNVSACLLVVIHLVEVLSLCIVCIVHWVSPNKLFQPPPRQQLIHDSSRGIQIGGRQHCPLSSISITPPIAVVLRLVVISPRCRSRRTGPRP